jgi:signal transduction histidine kinase
MEAGRLAEAGLQMSVLVHELRQPMFAIKGVVQMLIERAGGNDMTELELLLNQVVQAEAILERYGPSFVRATGCPQIVELSDIVNQALQSVRGAASNVHIETDLSQCVVNIDPVSVHQIVSNLVRNAVDAARSTVHVRLQDGVIQIQDDGDGVPAELIPKLYEPFVTTKPPGEGTGLGLFVTSSLVETIGATMDFDTSEDGTVVTVTIPKP